MMNRYSATLYQADRNAPSHSARVTRRYKTAERAIRAGKRMFASLGVTCTRYDRTSRLPWVEVRDDKTGRYLHTVDVSNAPVRIVPSVGELGYW